MFRWMSTVNGWTCSDGDKENSQAPWQQWLWTISGEYFNTCQRFDHFWLSHRQASQQEIGKGGVVQHVCWKCSQVLFAHDLPSNGGKHCFVSIGKILTQDKLADCKGYHMTAVCMIANINSQGTRGLLGSRDQCVDLSGRPASHNLLWVPIHTGRNRPGG